MTQHPALPIGPDAYQPSQEEVEAILARQLARRPGPVKDASKLNLREPAAATKRFFDQVVTAAWTLSLRGQNITAAAVHAELPKSRSKSAVRWTVAQVQALLDSELGRRALADRGLALHDEQEMTYEMVAAIRALIDPRPMSHEQRLRMAGVTAAQYQGFLTYPKFRQVLQESTETALKGGIAQANQKLVQQVEKGDLKAIQYLHQLTGYWDPNKQQTLDAMQLMQELYTIIFRNVKDPETLFAVAAELEMLKRRVDMADGLNDAARPTGAAVDMAAMQELGEIPADVRDAIGEVPSWAPPVEAQAGLDYAESAPDAPTSEESEPSAE